MFFLTQPDDSAIARFLERQQASPLSYSPADLVKFTVDRRRVVIGSGPADFAAARDALYSWKMFPPAWTRVYSTGPVKVGLSVAVAIHLEHGERGEELFAVEMDRQTGDVIYNIEAASSPANVMAWLGYPYVRALQSRFRRDSAAAMMLR